MESIKEKARLGLFAEGAFSLFAVRVRCQISDEMVRLFSFFQAAIDQLLNDQRCLWSKRNYVFVLLIVQLILKTVTLW